MKTLTAPWLRHHGTPKTNTHRQPRTTRKTHLRTHDCGNPVLAGNDNDYDNHQATTDLLPLTPLGEAQALLAGTPTYDYSLITRQLQPRTAWHIRHEPAGTNPWHHILPEHHCNAPTYDFTTPTTQEPTDEPPY